MVNIVSMSFLERPFFLIHSWRVLFKFFLANFLSGLIISGVATNILSNAFNAE